MSETKEEAARRVAFEERHEGEWQCEACWRWWGDEIYYCPVCYTDGQLG